MNSRNCNPIMPSWLKERFRRRGNTTPAVGTHEAFHDDLYESKCTSNFPVANSPYWSTKVIKSKVTGKTVREVLGSARGGRYDDTLVNYIVEDARKLFVIVVLTVQDPYNDDKLLKIMKYFQGRKMRDSEFSTEIVSSNKGSKSQYLTEESLQGLDLLKHQLRTSMCDTQWKVLVPVFSTEKANYDFAGRTILPFSREPADGVGSGAFSTVWQVKIQPGHFDGRNLKVVSLSDVPLTLSLSLSLSSSLI